MKKRDFLKAGAGAAGVLAALPAVAQSKGASYNWKMTTAWPGGPLMDIGAKAFADRLAFFSGGRMKIQVFPGGALDRADGDVRVLRRVTGISDAQASAPRFRSSVGRRTVAKPRTTISEIVRRTFLLPFGKT